MDKRVVKTKRLICNAFVEIFCTKDINDITITEIANKAEVNRKTIYNYYATVTDILNEIEDSLIDNYETVINELGPSITLKNPNKIFEALTESLNSNIDFYSKLMKIEANSLLVDKIIRMFKKRIRDSFLKEGLFKRDDVDFITDYVVTGMISAYRTWFNNGMIIPIDKFSKNISMLVYNGIDKFVQNK